MGPMTQNLSAILGDLGQLLLDHGQVSWADLVAHSNRELQAGDFNGINRLLGAFGGMGSLNDVLLEDSQANDQLATLRSDAYSLARAIQREQ